MSKDDEPANEAVGQDGPPAQTDLPEAVWRSVRDDRRLSVLRNLHTTDHLGDADFAHIVSLAKRSFDAPIAVVTLVDLERQWFKANDGIEGDGTSVEVSFCAHSLTLPQSSVMVVENALDDPRFSSNPLVVGPPFLRFYAGAPIVVYGERIGTVCVLDTKPRPRPSDRQLQDLADLAELASSMFLFKDGTRRAAVAVAALAREQKRHALSLEAASIASWVWDVKTGDVECDPLLTTLFGLPESSLVSSRDIFGAIDPRDRPAIQARLDTALATGDDYWGEYRVRDVEPVRWLAARGRVIERDQNGAPSLVFGVNFDISEGRLGQERQKLLLRELNHRVKNTLATIQALATQTVRHAREPREFLEAFNGRLQALGLAHNLLSDHEWRGISLGELVEMQVLPLVENSADRLVVTGPKVHLSPDQAVALGLILHELATNAVKYGALSVAEGRVDLGWTISREGGREMLLRWVESGGPTVVKPTRRGFGSILIERSLGKVLSSQIEHAYLPDGVTATISMVLDEVEATD